MQGAAARILGHALHHAATVLGTRQSDLGVNARNTAAVAPYKKLDFVERGYERGLLLIDEVLDDEYQMVRHVGVERRKPTAWPGD